MKRLLVVLSTLGIFSLSFSQNHQISVGAGLISSNTAVNLLSSLSTNLAGGALNGSTLANGKHFGEFRFSYSYSALNWLSVGATYSYSKSTYDRVKEDQIIGSQTTKFNTLAGDLTFYYLKNENIRLYGLLGIGLTAMNRHDKIPKDDFSSKRNHNYLNFQLSPIGIEIGKGIIGGFFELGFGYRGIISTGVMLRL